jgi:endonuclease/exonuclease/phosphatase (EEP) superfamily protein YafD
VTALRIAAVLALLALLCLSLVPLLGPWPGDMVAPFRLQLAAAAMLGFAAVMALKDLRLAAFAGIVLAATVVPIAARLIDRPVLPETAPGQPVSLVVANVLCDNDQHDRVLALVREQQTDIFAAVETTPEWVASLDGLKDQYPHSFAPTTLGVFGVALYAKRPFAGTLLHVGRRQLPLLRADFGDLVVYVAHPMPPANARLTADNRDYIEALAAELETESGPVIIAGDLNTTLWSNNIEPLLRHPVQWPANAGLAYTWPAARPWMAIQIDQVLTRGMTAGNYRTLGDIGSDHYPVRVDLVI